MDRRSPYPVARVLQRQRGVGLIEILITLVVIGFGLLAHAGFQNAVMRSTTMATERAAATTIARSKLEDLRNFVTLKASDCGAAGTAPAYQCIATNSGGSLVASDDVEANSTTYTRHWTVKNYWYAGPGVAPTTNAPTGPNARLPDFKQVTVQVTWTNLKGKLKQLDLSSVIAGMDPAAGGDID